MEKKLLAFQRRLDDDGIIFVFRGKVSQNITEALGDAVKSRIDLESGQPNITQRVFSTFVEMVQNISHYSIDEAANQAEPVPVPASEDRQLSEDPHDSSRAGVIVIGHNHGRYSITCGNFLLTRDKEQVEERLKRIKQMSKDELKAYYKEQRRATPAESSKGAGLGFIEMARKASDLDYDFTDLDNNMSFFSLKVTV